MKRAIAYTDGGTYKQNPGPFGSAAHILLLSSESKSKPTSMITLDGYLTKAEMNKKPELKTKCIEPDDIIDIVAFDRENNRSNNVAELFAILTAVDFLKRMNYEGEIIIFTDSQISIYVISGLLKNNGGYSGTIDRAIIEEIWKVLKNLPPFIMKKIKGHSIFTGNNRADELATIGAHISKHGHYELDEDKVTTYVNDLKINVIAVGEQKKKSISIDTLLTSSSYLYIDGPSDPGTYYYISHKEESKIGTMPEKKQNYGIIITKPNPTIDALIDAVNKEPVTKPFVLFNKTIGDKRISKLNLFGAWKNKNGATKIGDTYVTKEISPVNLRRATKVMYSRLEQMLINFEDKIGFTYEELDLEKILTEKGKIEVGSTTIPYNGKIKHLSELLIGYDTPRVSVMNKFFPDGKAYIVSRREGDMTFFATLFMKNKNVNICSNFGATRL